MAVAVWEGQASSGDLSVSDKLQLETAVMQDGDRQCHQDQMEA